MACLLPSDGKRDGIFVGEEAGNILLQRLGADFAGGEFLAGAIVNNILVRGSGDQIVIGQSRNDPVDGAAASVILKLGAHNAAAATRRPHAIRRMMFTSFAPIRTSHVQ